MTELEAWQCSVCDNTNGHADLACSACGSFAPILDHLPESAERSFLVLLGHAQRLPSPATEEDVVRSWDGGGLDGAGRLLALTPVVDQLRTRVHAWLKVTESLSSGDDAQIALIDESLLNTYPQGRSLEARVSAARSHVSSVRDALQTLEAALVARDPIAVVEVADDPRFHGDTLFSSSPLLTARAVEIQEAREVAQHVRRLTELVSLSEELAADYYVENGLHRRALPPTLDEQMRLAHARRLRWSALLLALGQDDDRAVANEWDEELLGAHAPAHVVLSEVRESASRGVALLAIDVAIRDDDHAAIEVATARAQEVGARLAGDLALALLRHRLRARIARDALGRRGGATRLELAAAVIASGCRHATDASREASAELRAPLSEVAAAGIGTRPDSEGSESPEDRDWVRAALGEAGARLAAADAFRRVGDEPELLAARYRDVQNVGAEQLLSLEERRRGASAQSQRAPSNTQAKPRGVELDSAKKAFGRVMLRNRAARRDAATLIRHS